MSRYAVAMTLSSWKKKGRRGKRRRAAGRGARRGEARPASRAAPQPEADRPGRPSRRGEGRRGGPRSREEVAPEPELDETELEEELDEETEPDEPEPDEAESDDEDGGDEDLGEERPRGRRRREKRGQRREEGQRRGRLGERLRDAVTRDWQKPQALGPGMRLQTRQGLRAAIVEVKPGLFVVAEVPAESVEFGFGPMLLAPALMKTLGRALQGRRSAGRAGRAHRPELSTESDARQLPGPVAEAEPKTEGLARWLDADVAAEIGCPARRPGKRRKP